MQAGKVFVLANPFWRIRFWGLDRVDKTNKGVIFIGNHQSFLDMPVFARLPFKMKWVSKKELFRLPVAGWLMKMSGHVSIDRGAKTAVKAIYGIVPYLEGNVPVMVYPEGTRSKDGNLNPFKNGVFIISKETNFPVQPIVLYGTHAILKSGDWKISRIFDRIDVSVLDPIYPEQFEDFESMKSFAQEAVQHELDRLAALRIQKN